MKKKKSCLALSEQPLLMLISAAHLEMQLLGSGWDRGSTMLIWFLGRILLLLLYNIPDCSCRGRLTEGTVSSCHLMHCGHCALLIVDKLYKAHSFTQFEWASEAALWEPATLGKTPACVCGIREGLKEELDNLLITHTPGSLHHGGKGLPHPSLGVQHSAVSHCGEVASGLSWHKLLLSPETGLSALVLALAQLEKPYQETQPHTDLYLVFSPGYL